MLLSWIYCFYFSEYILTINFWSMYEAWYFEYRSPKFSALYCSFCILFYNDWWMIDILEEKLKCNPATSRWTRSCSMVISEILAKIIQIEILWLKLLHFVYMNLSINSFLVDWIENAAHRIKHIPVTVLLLKWNIVTYLSIFIWLTGTRCQWSNIGWYG